MSAKTIIVTGASRGIGQAVALQALRNFDCNVVAVARTEKGLAELRAIVQDEGLCERKGRPVLETITGDITCENVVKKVVARGLEIWGRIDGVVANAGYALFVCCSWNDRINHSSQRSV